MDKKFDFDDLYHPPEREFIQNSLSYGLLPDSAAFEIYADEYSLIGSFSPLENISRRSGKLLRWVIKFAQKNKDLIKRTPVIRDLALRMKRRIIANAMRKADSGAGILDLSGILSLEAENFIIELYDRTLGRTPDPLSMTNSINALNSGLQKEALVYLICTSKEFAGRAKVLHLNQYKKIYFRYHVRAIIRNLPVINWIWDIAATPRRLGRLEAAERERYEALTTKFGAVESCLEKVNQNDAGTQTKLNDLASALAESNQNIIYANVKLDALASAVGEANKPIIYGIPGGITAVRTKEFIIGIPSEEWRLAIFLRTVGAFEFGTEKYFCSILNESMNVLDIGANLGIYTLHGLSAGCHVYSYEPNPNIYKILLDNVGINGFEPTGHAHTYNLAVSDAEGQVEFSLLDISGHNSMFHQSTGDKRIKVDAVSLDNHIGNLTHIDVVKIDVEGAEPLVLKGMEKIINNNPNIKIIMEFAPSNLQRGGTNPIDFIKTIRNYGFGIKLINESSGELSGITDDELSGVYSVNIVLQKENRA